MSRNNSKYSAALEAKRHKNDYPYNLLFDIFPELNGDKFAHVYIQNIKLAIHLFTGNSDLRYQAAKHYYVDHKKLYEIGVIMNLSNAEVNRLIEELKEIIFHNKEIIFNGFEHSKAYSDCVRNYVSLGFTERSASGLVSSGFYCITDINSMRDGKEFIKRLSNTIEDPDRVGTVFQDTLIKLNDLGYDTSRFGYNYKTEERKENDYHYAKRLSKCSGGSKSNNNDPKLTQFNGMSDNTFKMRCPICKRFTKVHITGTIDTTGNLHIVETNVVKKKKSTCSNCMRMIDLDDNILRFIRNYN